MSGSVWFFSKTGEVVGVFVREAENECLFFFSNELGVSTEDGEVNCVFNTSVKGYCR